MPDWDVAYAATEAREVINPRPVDEANIFRLLSPLHESAFSPIRKAATTT